MQPNCFSKGATLTIGFTSAVLFSQATLAQASTTAVSNHVKAAIAAERAGDAQRAIKEWSEVLQLAPDYAPAFYYRSEDYDELALYPEAIADASEYIRRVPKDSAGWRHRGIIYADAGQIRRGLADCERALELNPRDPVALALRGDIHRLSKDWKAALQDADAALRFDPQTLAGLSGERSRLRRAKGLLKSDRGFHPGNETSSSMAEPTGRSRRCLLRWRKLQICPRGLSTGGQEFPASARAHDSLARFLASCPNPHFRNGKQAVHEAILACNLSGWKDAYALSTLAAALAEIGDFKGAIKQEERALANPMLIDRTDFEKDLANYRRGKPSRNKP